MKRTVKLFRIGRAQVVRIPRHFELPGEEAVIEKQGDRLVLSPVRKRIGLLAALAQMEPLDDEFPPIEDLPPDPVDLSLVGAPLALLTRSDAAAG
jgi:antitoxin VapB